MPLKKVTDPNLINSLENRPKLKKVTDPELLKALDTDTSTIGAFSKGFTHTFDEYAASINKALDFAADKVTGRDTKFFEDNQKFWNKQKKLNALETYKHPYAKLAGEVLLDPINLTPAGVATKGAKLARVAKSMAGGAAVGGATMAFKNYGDQSKTAQQKQDEIAMGAGLGALINGVVAALTKGKIKEIVHPGANDDDAKVVVEALKANPEAFGLTKGQAAQVEEAVSKHYKEIINPNIEPNPRKRYRPDWRFAVEEGTYPARAKLEPEFIERPRAAGLIGYETKRPLPYKDVIYSGWDKDGMLPPPDLPIERYRTTPKHPLYEHIEKAVDDILQSEEATSAAAKSAAAPGGGSGLRPYEPKFDRGVYERAYHELPIEEVKVSGEQRGLGLDGEQGKLFDTLGETRYKTPRWAQHLVNDTTRYEDIVAALREAKQGRPNPLADRAIEAMTKDEALAQKVLPRNEGRTIFDEPTIDEPRQEWHFDDITEDPLFQYVLDLARNRSAKQMQHSRRRIVDRYINHVNNGDGWETQASEALYDKNYDYDFMLSKQDVKRIEKALRDGKPIPDELMEKIKNDIGVLEHSQDWSDEAEAIRREAMEVFSGGNRLDGNIITNPGINLGTGFTAGTLNAYDTMQEGGSDEEIAESFIRGLLAGAAGVEGLRLLKKTNPKAFEKVKRFITENYNPDGTPKNEAAIGAFLSKMEKKEKRGIYNVTFNDKQATIIRNKDLNDVIKYEKGNRKFGAIHILKHLGEGKVGEVTKDELLKIGDVIRNGNMYESYGKRVYELYKDGVRYRVVTGERNGNEKVITFYSDRNLPARDGSDIPQITNDLAGDKNIISQDDDGVQIGAFFGKAPKVAQSEQKEFAPHLRKIVSERLNKEWSDISRTIKGELNRWLTNTFSGEYLNRRDELMAAKNEVALKAERLHEALKLLPQEDRRLLHEYIVGDIEPSKVPEEIKQVGENVRATIKELTNKLVKEGILSEAGVKEWGEYYLKREYEKHFKKLFIDAVSGRKTLQKLYQRGNIVELDNDDIKALQEYLEPLGIKVDGFNTIDEFLANNDELLAKPLREGGLRVVELPNGKIRLKRDWTKAERDEMGEIRDAAITIPETILHLGTLAEHAKFLKDIASVDGAVLPPKQTEGLTEKELSNLGYVKLPKSPRYGALSGLWVRKDVRDDIDAIGDNFIDAMLGEKSLIREIWDGYMRVWKKSKTIWNAPAHVNNFLSNLFLMHLSGLKSTEIVKRLANSTKLLADGEKYEQLYKRALVGKATPGELSELKKLENELGYYLEAKKLGLLNQSQFVDIMKGAVEGYDIKDGALQKLDKAAIRAYQLEDEVNKLATYITLRERGWSKEEARQGVEVIMPDYTQPMPKFWRLARDTGISPFIAWNYYTIPKILRLVKTKEGATRAAIALGSVYGLSYLATGLSPAEHIPGVDTDVPEWAKERYVPIAASGSDVTMIKADRWLPYLQMLHPLNYARDLASGVTTNFMVSTLTGNKLYNNRPIANPKDSIGKQVYDTAKYYAQSFVPLPQQLYSAYDLLESVARGNKRSSNIVKERTTAQNIAKLLGINTITYNKAALRSAQEMRKK